MACMRLALADAGLTPGDIAHVNAHGTSTSLNDAAEAAAMAVVFGPDPVPSPRRRASPATRSVPPAALELAAVLLSFEHRLIPPTADTEKPDPDFQIDLVLGEARPWTPGPTMSNNFGFGGHNGSIIVTPS